MKPCTRVSVGLILVIILSGLFVVPVCASDDSSWFSPDTVEDILAWMKMTSRQVLTTPTDDFGAFTDASSSYNPPDDSSWAIPASKDQIIVSGMIARQPNATSFPATLSQADRIRLFKSNSTNGIAPVSPGVTLTPRPATQPVFQTGSRFTSHKQISMPAEQSSRPSKIVTVVPTPTSRPGDPGSDQKTGISLTELNLQGNYVRITNMGPTPVVMTGWKIMNSRGNSLTFIDFPLGDGSTFTYILNPYSTLTVYFGKEGMMTGNELYYPPGVDFWNPQVDTASLYDPQGQLIGMISETPSKILPVVPTPTYQPGDPVSDQKTGISLTELNLQGNYVRIINMEPTPVVMTGWKISNSQGNSLTFIDYPLGGGSTFTYILNPYSTLTVYFGKEGMMSSNELYYPTGVDFWNPQGDTASLYDPQGNLAGSINA